MAHIGILCPTLTGHLNPMMAIGRELQRRSHRVTIVGLIDGQAQVVAAGLDFLAIGMSQFPLGSTQQSLKTLGELNGLAALNYSLKLVERATGILLEESPAAIAATDIDCLLVDQSFYSGSTIAELLNLPFITVCCALMFNPEPDIPPFFTPWRYQPTAWGRLRNQAGYQLLALLGRGQIRQITRYRQQRHLPPLDYEHDTFSNLAQICQQPVAFEFPRQSLPGCLHFVGPCIDVDGREPATFPFAQLTRRPLIYASLGTLQNQLLWLFRAIAIACQNLDVQLVIALGGGTSPAALPTLPGSPLVVGYAPQVELLQQATLTITHAGMNTVLESLSNGVPMVAIPITNDQPGVAARIAWTGAGEYLTHRGLTAPKLHCKIHQVLTQPSYRQSAQRLRKVIQATGGAQQAADIIEQVISTGEPVLNAQHRPQS
ncbi:glycosyltransferase [Oscillatoria sp. CS-180]|uniref:glycosyltransferase n=1 Tax=Oscillatoria sp. CS-180 TaxID=3021720 RepID=UPI00232E7816|nr:nucleotide disphospho-sugar-binding domain-containing protein [Oscillatoria sp. CS-180]MDB9528493.1 glycosyltransferase [Oscillatoria sp. CS-180]